MSLFIVHTHPPRDERDGYTWKKIALSHLRYAHRSARLGDVLCIVQNLTLLKTMSPHAQSLSLPQCRFVVHLEVHCHRLNVLPQRRSVGPTRSLYSNDAPAPNGYLKKTLAKNTKMPAATGYTYCSTASRGDRLLGGVTCLLRLRRRARTTIHFAHTPRGEHDTTIARVCQFTVHDRGPFTTAERPYINQTWKNAQTHLGSSSRVARRQALGEPWWRQCGRSCLPHVKQRPRHCWHAQATRNKHKQAKVDEKRSLFRREVYATITN